MKNTSLFAFALLLVGCAGVPSSPASAATLKAPTPTVWSILYSPSTARGTTDASGVFSFNFTKKSDGTDYVVKSAPRVLVGQTIKLVFEISGSGKLLATEGTATPRIKLFMQQAGDSMTAVEQNKRWWSAASIELLTPGVYELTAKVVPEQWTQVFGKNGSTVPIPFARCVANLARVGFTFGGMFAGHGVYSVGGDVRFTVKSFEITP